MRATLTILFIFCLSAAYSQQDLKAKPRGINITVTTYGKNIKANGNGNGNGNGGGGVIVPPADGYILAAPARTSAAVYKPDGTMVRTLWSGENKAAGTYPLTNAWDGKLDDLVTTAPAGNYKIIVQASNIVTTWEGVIGNTSDSLTGPTVHRQFAPWVDMCIVGNNAYVCADFAEREGSTYQIDLSKPQQKIDFLPSGRVQQITDRLCSDGVRLYFGGVEASGGTMSFIQAATFPNIHEYNNYLPFQGVTVRTFGATYKACDTLNNSGRISGMAVQQAGNWLFSSRKDNNSLHVLHKTTGVLMQKITILNPTVLAIDGADNLWVAQANGTVQKFNVNATTGALTASGITVSGITNVQGMTERGGVLTIADAGTNHQVKGYNAATGSLLWVLGRAESYATNAQVYNDKFAFRNADDDPGVFSFVQYQSDGSLWVGDKANYRYLKFNSSRVYQTQIAWLPHIWSSYVDPNTTSRVFADYLEFTVQYEGELRTGWQLVKNWGYNVLRQNGPNKQDSEHDRVKSVTTFPQNGRTYALQHTERGKWEVVELVNGGTLRFTGIEAPRYQGYQIMPNGNLAGVHYAPGGWVEWLQHDLQGFTGANNPIWAPPFVVSKIQVSGGEMIPGSEVFKAGQRTSSGLFAAFAGGLGGTYHLAGMPIGATAYKWKTAKTINSTGNAPYPTDGRYEVGKGTQYAGSTSLAMDSIIIWGNRGEFYAGGQTNIWNIVSDKGLFLKQFGTITDQSVFPQPQAQAEMAGNAFSPSLVKVNDVYYLWHNDESFHGGIHRWKIQVGTIKDFTVSQTKP